MQVAGLFQIINTPLATKTLSLQSSSALLGNPTSKQNCLGNNRRRGSYIVVKHYNIKQRSRKGFVRATFGFELGPQYGIEKAAAKVVREFSTLLVYQDILKKAPAKAFLNVLNAIRDRETDRTLMQTYGVFFKLMASGSFSSWQDFVLDSILAGEGCPFAIAAANVGNPESIWSRGVPKPLRLAAAADLDNLQTVSTAESTLAGWVVDIVSEDSGVKSDWKLAATSDICFYNGGRAYSSSPMNSVRHSDSAFAKGTLHIAEASELQKEGLAKTYRKDDTMEIDREMWRKKIGELVRWSEAVPLLEAYYATHSYGKLASVPVFRWQEDKLVPDKKFCLRHKSMCAFSHQRTHLESLQKNFRRHASCSPAQYVLLCGPSGVGKTQLLRAAVYDFAQKGELRIVSLVSDELKTLHKLLEDLAQHWQLRFVILLDDLILKGGEEHIRLMKSALDRSYQDWPSNIILCGTSTHSLQSEDGYLSSTNLRSIFGMVIQMKDLSPDEYLVCVEELLDYRRKLLPSVTINMDNVLIRAKEWGGSQNVYTVQGASHFVNSIFHCD